VGCGAVRDEVRAPFSHSAYPLYVSPGRHGPFPPVPSNDLIRLTDGRAKKDVVVRVRFMGELDPDPRRS
jgi:hypothetical protein